MTTSLSGLFTTQSQGQRRIFVDLHRPSGNPVRSTGGFALRGKKILLVEDDEDIQRFVGRLMELEGADLTVCGSVEQGEAEIGSQPFDLVLLDVNLPGRSGWDLLAATPEHRPPCPIIVFTASVNPEYEQKAFALGAAGFITKPVGARELVDQIKSYLTPN